MQATEGFWQMLRRRKVVQWTLAYVTVAWALTQAITHFVTLFHGPERIAQAATLLLIAAVPLVTALAWFHGDRGVQRVSWQELGVLATLAALVAAVGIFYWLSLPDPIVAPKSIPSALDSQSDEPLSRDSRPSIAVLPFANRSPDTGDAYFVDGIHDDILTHLSTLGVLRVISRSSTEQFRDSRPPLGQIAKTLGVTTILEGSVQRAGDRVRIAVQLIDARTDAHLWAESYDRQLTAENIFAVQSEISSAIARSLQHVLPAGYKPRKVPLPTNSLAAWETYHLARQQMAKRNSAALQSARDHFTRAIELDPDFAHAYSGLAEAEMLAISYSDAPRDLALSRMERLAAKALALDPNLAEAWTTSAVAATLRYDCERAEPMFRKAIALNPNYPSAHHWLATNCLESRGRNVEAISELETAAALDPLSQIINTNLGDQYLLVGRIDDARRRFERVIEIDPNFAWGYVNLAFLHVYALDQFVEGTELLIKGATLDPGNPTIVAFAAAHFLELGDDARAQRLITHALARWPGNETCNQVASDVFAVTGRYADAARHARKALAANPRDPVSLLYANWAFRAQADGNAARSAFQAGYPEFFAESTPIVTVETLQVAWSLVPVFVAEKQSERAASLLSGMEVALKSRSRLGPRGTGLADVAVAALQGKREVALSALRDAESVGWRGPDWRGFRDLEPAFESIRGDKRFKAVFDAIARDISNQRQIIRTRGLDEALIRASMGQTGG